MLEKTEAKNWQMKLLKKIAEEFEDVEVEIHQGQQPVYPYLFSVE